MFDPYIKFDQNLGNVQEYVIRSIFCPYSASSGDRQELPLRRSKSGNMISSLQHTHLPISICKSLDFIFSQSQGSYPPLL